MTPDLVMVGSYDYRVVALSPVMAVLAPTSPSIWANGSPPRARGLGSGG